MRTTILPASKADAPALLALQRLAYQTEAQLYDDWDIPPLRQTLPELEAEFARMAFLKAETDGNDGGPRLVGTVRAEMDGDVCRIGRLAVHPQARRQGLGAALLAAMEAAHPFARRFALFTGWRSEDNLRLYRRLGYAEVSRREVSPGLTLIFLEKPGPRAA